MFVLHDLPCAIDPARLDALREAEPATVGHFREVGFMDSGIRRMIPGYVRIAGTAVTVRCHGADTASVHDALGKLRPGDVLVVDRAATSAICGVRRKRGLRGARGGLHRYHHRRTGDGRAGAEARRAAGLGTRTVHRDRTAVLPARRVSRRRVVRRSRGRTG